MRIASSIARILMGVMFTVFGLNGFLHFVPNQPLPPQALQFIGLLASTHYMVPVFVLQLACGLLLLANRYVPLALTLIGPVIVNILLFHLLMNLAGIVPGAVVTMCWFVVFASVRSAFAGLFVARSPASAGSVERTPRGAAAMPS